MRRYERNEKLERGWRGRTPLQSRVVACSICNQRVYWSEMDAHDMLAHPDFYEESIRWVSRMKRWFVIVISIVTLSVVVMFFMSPDVVLTYWFELLLACTFLSAFLIVIPLRRGEVLEKKYRDLWNSSMPTKK